MSIILFLGRHGQTKLNAQKRLRGHLDEPLDKHGVEEAEDMGVAMSKTDIDRVYCSSLDRTDHTARIVAAHHDLKPIPREWFKPLDYGSLQGKKVSEIQPTLDRLNEEWKTDPTVEAPGGGESFKEFQDRNLGGLHAILKNAEDGEQLMLVAHLRNCLLFHGVAVSGGPLQGDTLELMKGENWHQPSGAVSKFEWNGELLRYVGMFFEPEDAKTEKAGVS
jgi:broad specificity phosphatase PhoE